MRGALRQDAGEHRQRVGRVCRIGEAVDAGHDVVGLHLAAGVEFHALAQLEGPHRAVVVRLPAFGQRRLQHEVRAVDAEEFGDLLHDEQAAGIGDGDRVDRRGRHAAGDADGGAGGARGAGERRHAAEAGGRGDAAQKRQRQAEQAAVANEVAAADTAVDETVDQVVFERRAAAPDQVENAVVLAHGFNPFPCVFVVDECIPVDEFRGVLRSRPIISVGRPDCSMRFCLVHPLLGAGGVRFS